MIPKEILDRVKEKTGATEKEINDVNKSIFSLVVKLIREGKMKGVKLLGFGSFFVNPKRLNKMKEMVIKKSFDELA